MLGVNIGSIGWPACGEIDIMEHINNENGVHGTIHWSGPNGNASYGGYRDGVGPSGWHNYQINWNTYSIRWYVDGNLYHIANITNNINSTEEFHRDFFIILNLAVGGNWPGNPNNSTPFPSTLWVDYVAVYAPNTSLTARVGNPDEGTSIVTTLPNHYRESQLPADPKETTEVTAFPSPFMDRLNYKVPAAHTNHIFKVFDMRGNPLLSKTVTSEERDQSVDLNDLPKGYYVVRIVDGNYSKSIKVKKE